MSSQEGALRLRRTLAHFTTGVTVVTTSVGDSVHGMTLNAFIPLSLTPPLVAVSIARKARMHDLLAASGRFVVNILGNDQIEVSAHFAGSTIYGYATPFVWENGFPRIEGALAHISASVTDSKVVGDHTLYIGHVDCDEITDGTPLVFFGGKYRDLSEKYVPSQYVDAWSMFDVVP
jgi:flavin reductase (DIM6/NTAB) family NADH-FMN oxidoreductase RutF